MMDLHEYASLLLQYHGGQSDPLYALGSSLIAGNTEVLLSASMLNSALGALERFSRSKGLSREAKGELSELIDTTNMLLQNVYRIN
jgi:hypothetical protein